MADWTKNYYKIQTQVNRRIFEEVQSRSKGNVAQWLRDLVEREISRVDE